MSSEGNLKDNFKDRTLYFDFLRVLATLAVVILHVSAQKYHKVGVDTWEWQVFNVYDSIVRWSVPIFVMISGALFLNGNHDIKKIYKKNIARIILSFVFWSALYAAVSIYVSHCGWKQAFKEFFLGHYHMWFLYMIVGLYMIVPLVKMITPSRRHMEYFLALALLFTFIVPQAIAVISLKSSFGGSLAKKMVGYLSFYFTLGYAGYFVAGYYLSKTEISKRVKNIIYILGICGFAVTIVCTSLLSVWGQKADTMFYGNLTVNVMLESIAVFIFIKDIFSGRAVSNKAKKALRVLSKYSFGAYLVHALVLEELERLFGLHALSFSPFVSVPVISVVVFVISFVISGALNHAPLLRKIV